MWHVESRKNQFESWKSPGNLFLKKGMNPEIIIIFSGLIVIYVYTVVWQVLPAMQKINISILWQTSQSRVLVSSSLVSPLTWSLCSLCFVHSVSLPPRTWREQNCERVQTIRSRGKWPSPFLSTPSPLLPNSLLTPGALLRLLDRKRKAAMQATQECKQMVGMS